MNRSFTHIRSRGSSRADSNSIRTRVELTPLHYAGHDQVVSVLVLPVTIACFHCLLPILPVKGEVHVCGYGALGLGRDIVESLRPKKIDGLTAITKVFAATDYAAAILG